MMLFIILLFLIQILIYFFWDYVSKFHIDLLISFIAISLKLTVVLTLIFILRWIYFANFNAHQLGAIGMRFTPGWSIGWFFIPIANFWKPYQVMKELWQVSKNSSTWRVQSVSPLVPWWWFLIVGPQVFVWLGSWVTTSSFILLSFITLALIERIYQMQMLQYNQKRSKLSGL
jgi:hypothetical protein